MLCFLCYLPLSTNNNGGMCSQCLKNLVYLNSVCYACGLPVLSCIKNPRQLCYRCLAHKPAWNELIAVTDYELPIKKLIHQFKFYGKLQLGHSLARLMFITWYKRRQQSGLIRPDIVTCIPLHHSKYWSRGYNQAELLAKPIARWLQCSYQPFLLTKKQQRLSQKILSKQQRHQNIQNVFNCEQNVSEKSIAIIDDIVTTGFTVNEASKQLLQRGAKHIQIICLCRTIL